MKRMTVRQPLNRGLLLGLVSVAVMSTAPAARAAAAARPSFAVKPGHPRIFLTQKDLPALRKRIETTHARQWRGMKKWADGQMGKERPQWSIQKIKTSFYPPRFLAEYWFEPPSYAFLYRLGGEPRYADEAITMARKLDVKLVGRKGDLGVATQAETLALVYDWCYDRLTADDKAALLKNLETHAAWLLEYTGHRYHPMSNHLSIGAGRMGLAGLAMHGDHPHADKYIAASLSVITDFVHVHQHFSAPGDGMVGCEGGSLEYTRHALIPTFLSLEAFSSALGKDMFPPDFE
ncbi:MAG: hypothetical protein JXR37_03290, partial [Kiritimatiellae bacterium]|nr:hypothetical protein [Kiritimatiellia bacterium]